MSFVQFSKVSLAFGDRDILKDVSINLSRGTKAALAGANGSGKTTLMKVLAGIIHPDSGERAVQKETQISYLPQSGIVHKGRSLAAEADSAFQRGYELEAELEAIGDALVKKPTNTKVLLHRHQEIHEELEQMLWYRRDALVEQILLGLGFERSDFSRSVEEFSGGWQMRIALAKVLLEDPDILLLDEPTNYLDLEARNWLEQFLQNFPGGFLLVSHDRYFLDTTVNEVYEIFSGSLKPYAGNYSKYEKQREVEIEGLLARYAQQQEEIKKLEDFIRRFGAKATKAAQAQERQKMLDKMERIEIPENLKQIRFRFPPAPHSGQIVLDLEGIGKTYDGEKWILKELSLVIEKGERFVIAGRNGAGKTTLLRILSGEDANFEGSFRLGSGVNIGYFSQDNAEKIRGEKSILESLEEECPLDLVPKARDLLASFLFRGDDVYKSLDVLSGGEKSRLALLRLLLKPVNLLILDEPTNHLDLHSKDVLLSALSDFGGTILFVSHDRGFIESLATKVLELKEGKQRVFPGDYRYYLEKIEAENTLSENYVQQKKGEDKAQGKIESKEEKNPGQLSWEESKRRRSEIRKLEKDLEILLEKIASFEEQLAVLHENLSKPEVYMDGDKSKKIQEEITVIGKKMEDAHLAWEDLETKRESLL
ncbi:MAG TPA: ABC-F family ATP-binding cassette domain-containing protein [Treponemataceae bacterium]|nr:ABC-F family ATP-binding cassette domain-containing protein [Treponemataceae bacterium]